MALRFRRGATQYRARIPVDDHFAPNLTFSVLYTKGGDYSFQNAGIKVAKAQIEIAVNTDKELYAPGETVTVDLATQFKGQPAARRLTAPPTATRKDQKRPADFKIGRAYSFGQAHH